MSRRFKALKEAEVAEAELTEQKATKEVCERVMIYDVCLMSVQMIRTNVGVCEGLRSLRRD